MKVSIESHAGFCTGVKAAIKLADESLAQSGTLYCLGEIVHNKAELERFKGLGMVVINHEELKTLKNARVLLRAHGEPPETYAIAERNNLELIDASCPVVLKLQERIRNDYKSAGNSGVQIVIYGKKGHAEVTGLSGQTDYRAIVISGEEDFDRIDMLRPVHLYSQTTMGKEGFGEVSSALRSRMSEKAGVTEPELVVHHTICRQVSSLVPYFADFAGKHEIVIFVSGKNSSNGHYLFGLCKAKNARSYLVAGVSDLESQWFTGISEVGICGATSTPGWLMEEIAEYIQKHY